MLEFVDNQMALKAAVIKKSVATLDIDFARYIVLSALSLNPTVVYKTAQLMAHLQTMRIFKEKEKEVTEKDLEGLKELGLQIIPQTYLENSIQ